MRKREVNQRCHQVTANLKKSLYIKGGGKEPSLSEKIIQSRLTPNNEGTMEQPDGFARVTGPCGDTMEISLKIRENRVINSRFQVDGCAISRACASIAADLAKGKDLEEAWDIDQNTILQQFQQIPKEERHCALLAQNTLRQAIESFIKRTRKGDLVPIYEYGFLNVGQ